LETLYNLGFTRVSFGIQDYNETVQKAINRKQSFEDVKRVTELVREIGYTSVSHDLIFGLPFQTIDYVKNTIEKTLLLHPDRIAFYSYAHVPWIKGSGQRGYSKEDFPEAAQKRKMYQTGKEVFEKNGYLEIGMDHFATSLDNLSKEEKFSEIPEILIQLKEMEADNLVIINTNGIQITKEGKSFVRNVCMAFDVLLKRKKPEIHLFSMTV